MIDVKKQVASYKSRNYIVYYELVSTDFTNDSLLKDSIRRKARKLKGFSGTYKENAEGDYFKKYVQQPDYSELGLTANDVRADVNYLQLINQWEKVNGEIKLDSIDINTPFSEKFNKGTFYTKEEYNSIFIEYRNSYLIDLIKSSPASNILVLFGAGHRKNFEKQLKEKTN